MIDKEAVLLPLLLFAKEEYEDGEEVGEDGEVRAGKKRKKRTRDGDAVWGCLPSP